MLCINIVSVKSRTVLIMAIKLNKVELKLKKADVSVFNPQPNVYLKKSEEMHLGLHHSHSISLMSLRNFFWSCTAIVLVSTGTHLMYISLKGP